MNNSLAELIRDISVAAAEDDDDNSTASREARELYIAALQWWKRGYNVVPQSPDGAKHPAVKWKELQERRVTNDELLYQHAKFAYGVGFITGAISGVIVIETDGPEGQAVLEEYEQLYGPLPETLTIRSGSGRGMHRHFKHPGRKVKTKANQAIKIDVKGDGGFCVLPPSLHKSGDRYEIVHDAEPAELPKGLLEFIEIKAEEAAEAQGRSKGEEAEKRGVVGGDDTLGPMPAHIREWDGPCTILPSKTDLAPPPLDVMRAAVEYLTARDHFKDRETWIQGGMAFKVAYGDDVGQELWAITHKGERARYDAPGQWASFAAEWSPGQVTIATIIKAAKDAGFVFPGPDIDVEAAGGSRSVLLRGAAQGQQKPSIVPFDLDTAVPVYFAGGMPRREFAGPPVGDASLFPMQALSLFVSLGGVGKTSCIIAMAAHIAAGKPFGVHDLERKKVLVFCIEESQDELNRKYGASVRLWADEERSRAEENLRLVSCLDRDARLTQIRGRQVTGTGLAEEIIRVAKDFGAEVIVLDHLQGFVSGDLNISDTATTMAIECNKIVAATGAAVIQTAHISKANIDAQDVLDGFTTGSLAFENAARQVTGVIPLPDDEAKKLKLEDAKGNYLMTAMPKNSYGPSKAKAYLEKVYVPDFHTVTVEPYTPTATPILSAHERLMEGVAEYVKTNRGTTASKLDAIAGKKGQLKATKLQVREVVKELLSDGVLIRKTLTKEERKASHIPHQVKQVYEYVG